MGTFAPHGSSFPAPERVRTSPCLSTGGNRASLLPTHWLARCLSLDLFASPALSVVRTTFANSAAKHDTAESFARVGEAEFDALFKSIWAMYNVGASWQLYPETLSVVTVRTCAM